MSRDGDRQVARQLLEVVGSRHEIGLAVELDHRPETRAVMDVAADDAFADLPIGLLGGRREALLAEPGGCPFEVSVALLECSLAVHDAGAGLLAQSLDVFGLDGGRGHGSFPGFAGPATRDAPQPG